MESDDRLELNAMTNGSASHGSDHNINVVIRVRPIITSQHSPSQSKSASSSLSDTKKYNADCDQSTAIKFPAAGQIEVEDTIANTLRSFAFNVVFEPEASQEEVFEHSGVKRLIDMALDGFACTIFAYGQTSTGKTYTLTGNAFQFVQERNARSTIGSSKHSKKYSEKTNNLIDVKNGDSDDNSAKNIGVVQLSFAYLFEQIKRRKLRDKTLYVITVSYLEVYNEQDRGFYAENLFKVECEDLGDLEGVLEEGCKNRQVRSHSMNENSSRSHSVMTITLSSEMPDPEDPQGFIRKEGRMCLVDLAGSEKTKRTNSRGGTFVEANNINRSLLVLGNCIACLADPKRRNGHIPYRDSTLTKLLADSLSGNGMTLMIACISPLKCDSQETISTLRYAMRAKRVRMNPVVQMDPRELLILSLKREVRLLRMENNYLRQNYHQMWTNSQQQPIEPLDMNAFPKHSEVKIGEEDKDGHLLNKYMRENEVLRVENVQLNLQRNRLVRDHELVCRENEQLLKRLQSLMGKLNVTEGKQPLPINLQHNPTLFSSASSPSIFSLVSVEESKLLKAHVNSSFVESNATPTQVIERTVDSEDDNGLILIREKTPQSSIKNSSATQIKTPKMTEEKESYKNLDLTIRGKSAVSTGRNTARRRN